MDIIKHNGQWGVQDWADGYRSAPIKRDGYSPNAKVTWEDALKDPEGTCDLAMTAGQWRLATEIVDKLIP